MEGLPPEDDLPPRVEDPETPEGPSAGPRGFFPDTVKKALLAGVGALFMGEEGARRLARDWKLPKEVIGFIGQQASGAKDEVLRVLSDEIRRFLESDALRREFWNALSSAAIEVKAEIRLVPTDAPRPPEASEPGAGEAQEQRGERPGRAPLRPRVKASVRAKRAKGKGRR